MSLRKVGSYAVLVFILMWSLGPIYWTLRTSLAGPNDLTSIPPKYLPWPASFDNYARLFGLSADAGNAQGSLWPTFESAAVNSLVTCLASTVVVVVIAIFAGYVFARLRFIGGRLIFGLLIATLAIPAYGVIIPLYRIMVSLQLIDTYQGITLIYVSAFAPLAIWILRGHFAAIPLELDEAALVDGASRFRVILTVLPAALPGVAATGILTFLAAWSQFSIPLVFSPTLATKPLTVLISEFVGKNSVDYGLITAASMVTVAPPILIVVLLNRYLVSGLAAGAVKG